MQVKGRDEEGGRQEETARERGRKTAQKDKEEEKEMQLLAIIFSIFQPACLQM